MRDLLNLFQSALNEGVGLSNRSPGEQFKNPQGDVITFQSLDFWPESGTFTSPQEVDQGLAQAAQDLGVQPEQISWTNKQSGGGFGIAHFTDNAGKDYYLGRWFRSISPNRVQNNFPHNAIPGDFTYQSPRGVKEKTGYKPSEVLTQFQSNTPETILKQIQVKFGDDSHEAQAAQLFMQAETFPISIPKGNMNFTAFRDYFCEMLQPVALVMNKEIKGNASEAAEIFFGQDSNYGDCVISFNEGVTGGLYDSLLVNKNGKQIKLSSKGKSGANASVVNLIRSIRELQAVPQGKRLLKKYAQAVSILEIIESGGHVNAPLELAVAFGMLSAREVEQVISLKGLGPKDPLPQLSARLKKLYESRKANDPSRIVPIEHMLAAVAYKVADHVNNATDFSLAASGILNHSALVQMYTEAKETKDTIEITGFRAVYPSETVTGVLLDAAKAYMSTQGKGNFTFKILKNGAAEKDLAMLDAETDTKPDPDPDTNLVDYEPRRSDIKASDRARRKAPGDARALGRARRR